MSICLSVNLLRSNDAQLPMDWDNLPAGHAFFDGVWLVVVGQGNRFGKAMKQRHAPAPREETPQGPFAVFHEQIEIEADSTYDLFSYKHWRDQVLVRELRRANDGEATTWQRVGGTPEPWEQLLLTPNRLDAALDHLNEEGDVEGAASARRVWERGHIEQGFGFPACDASFALTLLGHLGLTFHQ